mmetsp:Transcript_11928/g.29936  ORF Transcript_11928/g.29936 Transcript_11928/m.29936 type:complete len:196 (-) Transcript_11928:37-624(-)
MPLVCAGRDRQGNPVVWARTGLLDPPGCTQIPIVFIVRHYVYMMTRIQQAMEEVAMRENRPITGLFWIEDNSFLRTKHVNWTLIERVRQCMRVAQDVYPELQLRSMMVKANFVFEVAWGIAKHFFDAGTRAKILFCGEGKVEEVLAEWIDPSQTPECYGGTLEVDPALMPTDNPVPKSLIRDILKFCAEEGLVDS